MPLDYKVHSDIYDRNKFSIFHCTHYLSCICLNLNMVEGRYITLCINTPNTRGKTLRFREIKALAEPIRYF